MSSSVALQPEPAPVAACTVSRDVRNFDLLISDMETEMGESWGDLSFPDAIAFLDQPDAGSLEFLAIAVDATDEDDLEMIMDLVATAHSHEIKVILIASGVGPGALHQLMRCGASDFLPYPLPDGSLHEAIEKIRKPEPATAITPMSIVQEASRGPRDGAILAVHGLAGGVGATTFAVNLAWELATGDGKTDAPHVCLLDLDLQTGSTATFLDLARRDMVGELLSDAGTVDSESLLQAMQVFEQKLHVFTAPSDMVPLDIIGPEDVGKILDILRQKFDVVIIDMPTTLISWTETVLRACDIYFALLELDMRSAQNALRFLRLLKSEELPVEKLRFGMNRAPRFTDLQGKSRVKRLADSLDIDIELMLPDGQKQVAQTCDHGLPLAVNAAKNPLRKEIAKLAASLRQLIADQATGG